MDASVADTGTELTVIWGEPNGGSSKPGVERHYLKEIGAKTAPWPYVQFARENYRPRK